MTARRLLVLAAAALLAACAPTAEEIMADRDAKLWADIEARTGKARAEVEASDAKILAERKAFCLKSPADREAQTQAEWAKLRVKPGVTWSSYPEYRLVIRQVKEC
jgi:hypothetical protein